MLATLGPFAGVRQPAPEPSTRARGGVGGACQNGCMSSPAAPDRPAGGTAVSERTDEQQLIDAGWVTIVSDDPVNLMSYVTHVFATYFGYPQPKADKLMLQVHNEGKAAVSQGSREAMETDVDAMHSYGLWATLEKVS